MTCKINEKCTIHVLNNNHANNSNKIWNKVKKKESSTHRLAPTHANFFFFAFVCSGGARGGGWGSELSERVFCARGKSCAQNLHELIVWVSECASVNILPVNFDSNATRKIPQPSSSQLLSPSPPASLSFRNLSFSLFCTQVFSSFRDSFCYLSCHFIIVVVRCYVALVVSTWSAYIPRLLVTTCVCVSARIYITIRCFLFIFYTVYISSNQNHRIYPTSKLCPFFLLVNRIKLSSSSS